MQLSMLSSACGSVNSIWIVQATKTAVQECAMTTKGKENLPASCQSTLAETRHGNIHKKIVNQISDLTLCLQSCVCCTYAPSYKLIHDLFPIKMTAHAKFRDVQRSVRSLS